MEIFYATIGFIYRGFAVFEWEKNIHKRRTLK